MNLSNYIYHEEPAGVIYCGSSLPVLRLMESESIQCCVTSPPYWGLRDYGVDGQLGLEKTPEEYVEKMVTVFREVRRVLKKDGTLWLNLGDSYASGKGTCFNPGGGDSSIKDCRKEAGAHPLDRGNKSDLDKSGLKPKDLIGVPWRVAFALQGFAVVPFTSFSVWADELRVARESADWEAVQIVENKLRNMDLLSGLMAAGWYLRSDIIWNKPNPMPESVTDRPTKSHEYIFLMSKSARYYYDGDAIKESAVTSPNDKSHHAFGVPGGKVDSIPHRKRESGKRWKPEMGGGGTGFDGHSGNQKADGTSYALRNKRSVWTVATQPFKDCHFAVFPEKLIEPCILAGSPKGGIVLDPFIGSGTVAAVGKKHGRKFVGIDLKAEYIDMAKQRLAQGVLF